MQLRLIVTGFLYFWFLHYFLQSFFEFFLDDFGARFVILRSDYKIVLVCFVVRVIIDGTHPDIMQALKLTHVVIEERFRKFEDPNSFGRDRRKIKFASFNNAFSSNNITLLENSNNLTSIFPMCFDLNFSL